MKINHFFNNPNVIEIESKGNVTVFEFEKDLTVYPSEAPTAYYASRMGIRRRQAIIQLNNSSFTISAGAMMWTAGAVKMSADVKGVGDFISKAISGKVTKESAIKPKYQGKGVLALEPTYKHILLEEVSEWGAGLVLEDGMFLACDSNVKQSVAMRANPSSALFGGEGLFNLRLSGEGIAALESPAPRAELIEMILEGEEIRIDGSYAIAWSQSLAFTVEKSAKSLVGSAISGEGLVNVYKGTGKLLMAPFAPKITFREE
jgi:uncharacterized protein (AIM24 family)